MEESGPKRELCGFIGKTGRPCMRTASCPFHTHIKALTNLMGGGSARIIKPDISGAEDNEADDDLGVKADAGPDPSEPHMEKDAEKTMDHNGIMGGDQENSEKKQQTSSKKKQKTEMTVDGSSASQPSTPVKRKRRKPSTKRREWTKAEHIVFLKGLHKHGKGSDAWKKIERELETRNVRQIQSHAQKYFLYLSQGTRNEDSLFHIQLSELTEKDEKETKAVMDEIKKQLKIETRHSDAPSSEAESGGDEDGISGGRVDKKRKERDEDEDDEKGTKKQNKKKAKKKRKKKDKKETDKKPEDNNSTSEKDDEKKRKKKRNMKQSKKDKKRHSTLNAEEGKEKNSSKKRTNVRVMPIEDEEDEEDGDYMEGSMRTRKKRQRMMKEAAAAAAAAAAAEGSDVAGGPGDSEAVCVADGGMQQDAPTRMVAGNGSIAERAKRRSRAKVNYEEIDEEEFWMEDEEEFRGEGKGDMKKIKDVRTKRGRKQYLVKWKGEDNPTWELEERVESENADLIRRYREVLSKLEGEGESVGGLVEDEARWKKEKKTKRKRNSREEDDEEEEEEKEQERKKNKKRKEKRKEMMWKKCHSENGHHGDGIMIKHLPTAPTGEGDDLEAALSLTFLAAELVGGGGSSINTTHNDNKSNIFNLKRSASGLPSLIDEVEAAEREEEARAARAMQQHVSERASNSEHDLEREIREREDGGRNLSSLFGMIQQAAESGGGGSVLLASTPQPGLTTLVADTHTTPEQTPPQHDTLVWSAI